MYYINIYFTSIIEILESMKIKIMFHLFIIMHDHLMIKLKMKFLASVKFYRNIMIYERHDCAYF